MKMRLFTRRYCAEKLKKRHLHWNCRDLSLFLAFSAKENKQATNSITINTQQISLTRNFLSASIICHRFQGVTNTAILSISCWQQHLRRCKMIHTVLGYVLVTMQNWNRKINHKQISEVIQQFFTPSVCLKANLITLWVMQIFSLCEHESRHWLISGNN